MHPLLPTLLRHKKRCISPHAHCGVFVRRKLQLKAPVQNILYLHISIQGGFIMYLHRFPEEFVLCMQNELIRHN